MRPRLAAGAASGSALLWRALSPRCTGALVDARSEGPGKGSEFVVRLPLASGFPCVRCLNSRGPAPRAFKVGRASWWWTIAETEPTACACCWNYSAQKCGSNTTAPRRWRQFGAYQPEVVLLDIGMPGWTVSRLHAVSASVPSRGSDAHCADWLGPREGSPQLRSRRLRSPSRQAGRHRRLAGPARGCARGL